MAVMVCSAIRATIVAIDDERNFFGEIKKNNLRKLSSTQTTGNRLAPIQSSGTFS